MAMVEVRVMRAIRGECEESEDGSEDEAPDVGGQAGGDNKWGAEGGGGSKRSVYNECVASVSSFSEGNVYALSQDESTGWVPLRARESGGEGEGASAS